MSLDSVPAVHADEDTEIGFTVLRHGVTPEIRRSRHRRSPDRAVSTASTPRSRAPPATTSPRSGCPTPVRTAGTSTGQFVAADLGTFEVTAAPGGGNHVDVGRRAVGQRDTRRGDGGVSPSSTSAGTRPASGDGTDAALMSRGALYATAAVAAAALSFVRCRGASRVETTRPQPSMVRRCSRRRAARRATTAPTAVADRRRPLARRRPDMGRRADRRDERRGLPRAVDAQPGGVHLAGGRVNRRPDDGMPLLRLSDDEIATLVDYLLRP